MPSINFLDGISTCCGTPDLYKQSYSVVVLYRDNAEDVFDGFRLAGELGLEEPGHVLHVLRLGGDLLRITDHVLDGSLGLEE